MSREAQDTRIVGWRALLPHLPEPSPVGARHARRGTTPAGDDGVAVLAQWVADGDPLAVARATGVLR